MKLAVLMVPVNENYVYGIWGKDLEELREFVGRKVCTVKDQMITVGWVEATSEYQDHSIYQDPQYSEFTKHIMLKRAD